MNSFFSIFLHMRLIFFAFIYLLHKWIFTVKVQEEITGYVLMKSEELKLSEAELMMQSDLVLDNPVFCSSGH